MDVETPEQIPVSNEPLSESSQLKAVQDLLSGAEKPTAEQPTAETQSPPEPGESWDIKTVAEKLQTDPAKLYDSLKVAIDGEEIPIGKLKDAYRPAKELEKAKSAWLEERTQAETERQQFLTEFQALLGLIPQQHLTQEFLHEAQKQSETQRQKQAEALLKAIPDWKDPVTQAADWADIKPVALKYGFTDTDIALAKQGFADHRFIAMARDLAKARGIPVEKPAPKKAIETKPAKAPTEAQRFGRLKGAVTAKRMSPLAAVEKLIEAASVAPDGAKASRGRL